MCNKWLPFLLKSELTYAFPFTITVDGGWGAWSDWETCPATCGGADQSRTRVCDNPLPENGGDDCTVDGSTNTETQRCHEDQCPSKSNIKIVYVKKNHESYAIILYI